MGLEELKRPTAARTFTSREEAEPETIPGLLDSETAERWEQAYRQTWKVARPRSREDIMLDCRFRDGSRAAFAYFHLGRILFDGVAITMMFGEEEVIVKGRNLERLYTALCQHRVPFIQEGNEQEEALKPKGEPHIEAIERGEDEVPKMREKD